MLIFSLYFRQSCTLPLQRWKEVKCREGHIQTPSSQSSPFVTGFPEQTA